MNKKEITIQDKQYPVCFDIQTIINFEDVTSHQFFGAQLNTLKQRIALIFAAVLSADKDTTLEVDTIMGAKDFAAIKQITEAFTVVTQLMTEFFDTPAVEKQNEPDNEPAEDEEETKKN